METRAPAVVAVVVTTGPAPRLRAALASLAAQDYDQCSVLVLSNGAPEGLEELVSEVVPSAFLRVLDENRGYAAACNEVLGMVEGASFFCFCHDDVELAPTALHHMVEEAFRANAGIVTPKYVHPEDTGVLLHVGLNADRFGATTERIEPGEVDHGQQDTARDVFVAPGGVTLVRADLFTTLGGFDDSIVVLGEDLDLCWRAQVAGSRVVVAPEAVVAHHELLANGMRELTAKVSGPGSRSLQSLSRRNRLSTMLTCYGRIYLLPTVLLLALLECAELLVAAVGRDRDRLGSVVGSWRWCLSRLRVLRRRHHELSEIRALDDHDVRRLQVAGASRLQTFGSRLVHEGVDVARGALVPAAAAEHAAHNEDVADHTVGFGAAFSDDASFDELDDLGRRERGIHVRFLATFRTQAALVVVLALLFAVGVRNLVASHLPLIGRLAPLDSWWNTWSDFFATWSPAGIGTGAPGMPGFGVLGFAGTFVFGRMGALPRAALVLSVPIGAIGMWRLLRHVGSNRARLVGAVAFVCLALGPNLVAAGRIDVLAALAAMPFLVRRLLATARVHPFVEHPVHDHEAVSGPWRTTPIGRLVVLGAMLAFVAALNPAAGVAFVVAALGLLLGGALVADRDAGRVLGVALGACVVAAVLLLPLTLDTLFAGPQALGVFGAPSGPWSLPGLGGLVRMAVGPAGTGWAAWLLPAAALLALVVGRAERFRLAARFAGMGLCSLGAALLVARHLLGPFTPDVSTLLVPYAVAVAALLGTGVAAFEQDVAAARFGWRQILSSAAMLAALIGSLPFIGECVSTGRFELPLHGFDTSLSYLSTPSTGGNRTLWLGDPRALPLTSWPITPGLAYATSTNGLPGGDSLFASPAPGAASVLSDAVVAAMHGDTVHLGRLLATAGITNVVVVTATAPSLAGLQTPIVTPPPATLLPALRHQQDLASVPGGGGVVAFANEASHAVSSTRPEPLDPAAPAGSFGASRYWSPALDPTTLSGPVPKGTLFAALAPAGDFAATVDGTAVARSSAFGTGATWAVTKGTAKITLDALPLNGLLAALVLMLWVLVAVLMVGTDRFARGWRRIGPARPRPGAPRAPDAAQGTLAGASEPEPGSPHDGLARQAP